jgi:hypothetical protein
MSCEICQIHKGSFKTEAEFVDVSEKISALVEKSLFVELEKCEIEPPFVMLRYKCKSCGEVWLLSVPDQAFRGGMKLES